MQFGGPLGSRTYEPRCVSLCRSTAAKLRHAGRWCAVSLERRCCCCVYDCESHSDDDRRTRIYSRRDGMSVVLTSAAAAAVGTPGDSQGSNRWRNSAPSNQLAIAAWLRYGGRPASWSITDGSINSSRVSVFFKDATVAAEAAAAASAAENICWRQH